MASFFEQADRNVIPNWRSFANTAKLLEVNGASSESNRFFKPDVTELLDDWKLERNIGIAAELVNFAAAFNFRSDEISEAGKFILNNQHQSSRELFSLAGKLQQVGEYSDIAVPEITSLATFTDNNSLEPVFLQIHYLKKRLINNPGNAICWVDLARFYSILGQNGKARRSMLNAVYLQPNNRFVLRSMSRFFAHNDEVDLAHDIIRKQEATKTDPWLIATEISMANLRGRNSVFVKTGLNLSESKGISPFNLSELNSALGTLEFNSGSHKRSKKLFASSLQDPNDNALAQAEWAGQKDRSLMIRSENQHIPGAFEASARMQYEQKNWDQALTQTKTWFLDLPFSKIPIVFGSHIARTHLNDHEEAIALGRIGLISHPNDVILLNNLVYSLCILGKLAEAEELLNKNESLFKTEHENVYWTATKGLFYFRKGLIDIGRYFYREAIEQARALKNRLVFNLAVVHYTREEVLAKSEMTEVLLNQLDDLTKDETNASVVKVKEEIRAFLARNQRT